jgi:hypothetical protein
MDQANLIRAGTPGTTGVISSEPCDERPNPAPFGDTFRLIAIPRRLVGFLLPETRYASLDDISYFTTLLNSRDLSNWI